jgi:DNA replication and repair protein RecF
VHLTSLNLANFRCHERLELALPAGLSVFQGPNGSGKTTLLEAVMLLATGRSPRTNWLRELLRWGSDAARVEGVFVGSGAYPDQLAVTLQRAGGTEVQKDVRLNAQPAPPVGELLQRLPVVLFEPEDLQLVKTSARSRRRFMNVALSGLRSLYLDDLLRYRRAVQQRNELLKRAFRGHAGGEELAPWTAQMVRAGAQLMADREWLVEHLGPRAAALYAELSGGAEVLELRYRPNVSSEEAGLPERMQAFYEALENASAWELRRGATQVGPHRDELVVLLDGKPARDFGSQGQQRTAALSLKLAQAQLLAAGRGEPPIVLLDDCLSELDERRQSQVLELVGQFDQLLLTTAGEIPAVAPGANVVRFDRPSPQGGGALS